MRLLIPFTLLVAPLLGQQALWVDLSGAWRFTDQNDPAMARPEFDDRGWSELRLPPPAPDDLGNRPMWLRRSVELPPWVDRSQLALTLGPFARFYAVYVNGVEIGRVGSFGTLADSQLPQPRTFIIPPAAAFGNPLVIAIHQRGGLAGTPPPWRLPEDVPYSLTYRAHAPIDAAARSMALQRERLTPSLVVAFAYLVFSVAILLAWMGDTDRRELPWLAALLIAASMLGAVRVWTLTPQSTPYGPSGGAWLYTLVKTGSWALSTTFVIVFLRFRLYWLLALLWAGWLSLQAVINYPQLLPVELNWFRLYLGFGLASGVASIALIAVGWIMSWKGRPPLSSHFLFLILALLSADRIVWFARTGAELNFQFRGYQFEATDLLSLALTTVMLALLLRRIAADRRDRLRLRGEMEAGRSAQLFLLGSGAEVQTPNFDVDPIYEPAAEVGGDFHWSRVERDGGLTVVVGDVSGKGLKAAMLVSVAIGILRNEKSTSPGAILGALNDGLAGHTGGGFLTCCCARFDASGRVTLANAGHPSPYCDGREVAVEAGLPLGVVAGVAYEDSVVGGERFTFVSDGVVEAENGQRELFGFDRTREISTKSATEIADAAKAWGQNDDITVVTVRRRA